MELYSFKQGGYNDQIQETIWKNIYREYGP